MAEFRLPSLGADMEAARLVSWYVEPGDRVARGDLLLAVETDKGIIDVEAFEPGVVQEILVSPGVEVAVGTPLAVVEGVVPVGEAPSRTGGPEVPTPAAAPSTSGSAAAASLTTRQPVSPAARRRAWELGVDPAAVVGTGPGGAVDVADIERAAATAVGTEGTRRAIAAAVTRSKREIPHYYLTSTFDFSPALGWLQMRNAERPVTGRLLYAVLLLKAVALALAEVPELNGHWREGGFVPAPRVDMGVVIALRGGGLVVPALEDVANRDLVTLMTAFTDLVARARRGRLRSAEVQGASVSVTSLGERGVEAVLPVIYPPQVAMVGFGSPVERVWPLEGLPAVRRVITASLAADHRVSDGHRGALFLAAIEGLLQQPERL